MKIDGLESDIVRKSRAYGIEIIADYIEANGEIGPDERKYIVEILRDKFPKKTGPKRQKDREKIEAEIVFEIIRTIGLIHNSGLTFQAQFPQPIPVTLF